jgi:hypothetical protein
MQDFGLKRQRISLIRQNGKTKHEKLKFAKKHRKQKIFEDFNC